MSLGAVVFIKGPVSRDLEARLRRYCSLQHQMAGDQYGETFAQVIQAGLDNLENQGLQHFTDHLKKYRGAGK